MSAACRMCCHQFPGVPVYASTLARGLLGTKIKEHKLRDNPVLPFDPGDTIDLGVFSATAIRIGHSIPDAMAICLKTPLGNIIHTGDFKFDQTPVDGKGTDFNELSRLGSEGVLCLHVRLHTRRGARLDAVGADRRRGVPGHHGRPAGTSHRGHLREQYRAHPAGAGRRG